MVNKSGVRERETKSKPDDIYLEDERNMPRMREMNVVNMPRVKESKYLPTDPVNNQYHEGVIGPEMTEKASMVRHMVGDDGWLNKSGVSERSMVNKSGARERETKSKSVRVHHDQETKFSRDTQNKSALLDKG